jgi:hypothetical protein
LKQPAREELWGVQTSRDASFGRQERLSMGEVVLFLPGLQVLYNHLEKSTMKMLSGITARAESAAALKPISIRALLIFLRLWKSTCPFF